MENLTMSLDEIIASKPKVAKGNKNKGSKSTGASNGKNKPAKAARAPAKPAAKANNQGVKAKPTPALVQPFATEPKQQRRQPPAPLIQQERPTSGGGIFGRLGNGALNQQAVGTSVRISNLNTDITATDIAELCGPHGETRRVEIKYNANGKSQGIAEVVFVKHASAVSCVKQLDGNTLDGARMHARIIAGSGGSGSNDNSHVGNSSASDSKNVRVGLFGTGLSNIRDDGAHRLVQPFDNNGPRSGGRPQHQRPRPDTNRNNNKSNNSNMRNNSNNNRAARGGRNNSGGERAAAAPTKTQAELDAEMDAYFSAK